MSAAQLSTPSPRIPLQMEIEFRRSYARRGEKGRLKNISLTGAFLELEKAERHLSPSDKVVITLFVGGRARQIGAFVIWNGTSGCGLKFQPSNNRDVQIVDDLMYFVENSRESQRQVLDSIFKKVS
jgi:PilZ domain